MRRSCIGFSLVISLQTLSLAAQETAAFPVASVQTEGVSLKGAMTVANGRATLGNNGEVTAGEKSVTVTLERGGTLLICPNTGVQIARDASPKASGAPGGAGLLFSLDRGAFEAHYTPGAYSDVVLTPDMRLLISGPGPTDLKLRVNAQGDTCVDNAGENAPYVVASSLMDGGAYRVRPGQRVQFVHGSLGQVVDNEREPCGCPATAPVNVAQGGGGAKLGGPSSTPADTAFPTAVSEGLQAPPAPAGSPVVPAGQAHAQVAATLSSNTPPGPPPSSSTEPGQPPQPVSHAAPHRGLFGSIGHFFAKVFGANS